MRKLVPILFLLPALAQTGPTYEEWTKYLLSAPDYRVESIPQGKWPYLEVLRKDRWRDYLKGPCDPQKDPNGCKDRLPWTEAQAHEFYLPLSSLEATREVARDLRKAWQRFEERYYWRVITELNNPAMWFAYCGFGLRGPELDPPLPEVKLMVPSEGVDTAFLDAATRGGSLDLGKWASAGLHRLDRYLPVPQVDPKEFCDNLGMSLLPIMYIPGFKIVLFGYEVFRTPGYPSKPLWFNWSEANARVERAMRHALTQYYRDYLADVARALLTPRPADPAQLVSALPKDLKSLGAPKLYLPVPWQGHLLGGGSVVAPVYTELIPTDPQALWTRLEGAWRIQKAMVDRAGSDLEKVYLYVQFYRQARKLLDILSGMVPGASGLKANLQNLVEAPLRGLLSGIPALKGCAGSLDEVAACATSALMLVDGAVKLKNGVDQLTGGKPQNEVIKAEGESPGLWKYEEAKRWLPPASLPEYEALGYAAFFQATNFLEVTNIPDMRNIDLSQINLGNWIGWAWSQLSRLVVYWHVPITIDVNLSYCPPCVIAYPSLPLEGPAQPLGVPPYTLPFALERTHWRWVSVPEGYEIPGVKGTPYKVLADLGSFTPDLSVLYRPLIGR